MAYLTKYTFSKLCRKLEIKPDIDLDFFLNHIYNDQKIYFMLNKFEARYLFVYKSLLDDEEKFKLEYYEEVPERIDTQSYVFEQSGKLKYHLNENCTFINKDFIDFNIPSEIQELGNKAVQEYRDWFKSKGYAELYFSGNLDKNVVVFNYNILFPRKYNIPVLNENYELIAKRPNSNSVMSDEEFDNENFLKTIEHLKKLYDNTFSCKILRTLSKFDYLLRKTDIEIQSKMIEVFSKEFITNYGVKNCKEKFKVSRDIKTKLMAQLIDYFKWTYKLNDKNFSNITLEDFGLECCDSCKKNVLQQSLGEMVG